MKIAVFGDCRVINQELRRLFAVPDAVLLEELSGEYADLLVLNEYSPALTDTTFSVSAILINSDIPALNTLPNNPNIWPVITYGLNSKACITASSFQDGFTNICVQRDFTTLFGDVCERRELRLPTRDPLVTLAAASIALVIGLCPVLN